MDDTIAAISTALGIGAISIIRVSGDESINIVNSIFKGKDLTKVETHTIHYGHIVDNENIIDEVLVTIMKSPKTFTKEDIVEINCHGGIATTNKVLELLLLKGARLAEPGEFTKRAFLNGRIDLVEADGIMNLINSKSEQTRKMSINQLNGTVSNKIKELRDDLVGMISNIEVNIDYPEYIDIEELTNEKILPSILDFKNKLEKIIKDKYVNIVALPFGTPYLSTHKNFSHIKKSTFNGKVYDTITTLRVGWEPDTSPFSKNFNKVVVGFFVKILSKLKIIKNKEKVMDKCQKVCDEYYKNAKILLKNKLTLFKCIGFQCISLTFLYLVPFVLSYALKINGSFTWYESISAASYVFMMGCYVPIPGATGGMEYGFSGFFGNFVSGYQLSAFLVSWRTITYYIPLLFGAIVFNIKNNREKIGDNKNGK